MEHSSQSDAFSAVAATTLEGQLREMYGRSAYTHKAHEKMADQYIGRYKHIKVTEIVLSAIASSSFLLALFGDSRAGTVVGSMVSAVLLGLTLYFKEASLTQKAREHTEIAAKLWAVREALLSLLVDMTDDVNVETTRIKRDELNAVLEGVYAIAPRTNDKAYRAAQKALKSAEELFFTDEELDKLLPKQLRTKGA
ncbi:SLATT domain-containing protein [Dyella sp. ASV21]|uniref:SLATT domain-containing protein n=1 Tax=Dyella sp. ASV21 TaxID=2795114 RepID=UPI0018EA5ED2|nr:SLATT domain-containing protein [Dyella sp. ASV21]